MRILAALAFSLVPLLAASQAAYQSARHKFELIESGRLKPGARVVLTPAELNAYVEEELRTSGPEGVRNPKLELGSGTAEGSAWIDFAKLQRAQGNPPGWLMSKLLEGERPVRVRARIRSGGGRATVDVLQVEISGVTIEGRLLDFLIQNYLLPNYPQAKVGQPFELGYHIEKIDVQPAAVTVWIGK